MDFQQRIDQRLSNIETDLAFIKGIIEGKSESLRDNHAKQSRILSIFAIVVAAVAVASRIVF